jgi:acetyl esterase/lipase
MALEDAEDALRMVRTTAAKWHLKPNAIGMVGFSVGGHLASMTGMLASPEGSPRLPGPGDPAIPSVLAVNGSIPRTFLVAADDDTTVNAAENDGRFFAALRAAKVPAELHIYSAGSHGFGF